ncbi:Sugar fermentation stimulation protein SfsA [hydrothermal vent metagenome]|uniref:Sugar fermentation stimulation protein SfsA n=1 Tax=hydrothermal vent metagenome TaxID=652676 RepID=A0A3B0V4I9_9ZZZZ
MRFDPELQAAVFLRRYKRFLVDVRMPDNKEITVYCPNTGRMTNCLRPGCDVLLSYSDNTKRKYPCTLELTRPGSCWIGVNTGRTNALVAEALRAGIIQEFSRLKTIRPEIKVSNSSRLDFLLEDDNDMIYLEVKSCTLAADGAAMFPDAVTKRGARHMRELAALRSQGFKAAVLFCVQRADADYFRPAVEIDPQYCAALRQAQGLGVMLLAYQAAVKPSGIKIINKIPIRF